MLTLYFRESGSGPVHSVQGVVLRVVAPLQNGTARATKPFRDAWNWTGDLFSAKSENAKLQKEVEQLRAGVANELTTQTRTHRCGTCSPFSATRSSRPACISSRRASWRVPPRPGIPP